MAVNPRKATTSPMIQFATADPHAYVNPFPGMATAVAASPVVATARAGMKSPPVRVEHCPLQARMADSPHPPHRVSIRKLSRTVKRPTTDARKLSSAKYVKRLATATATGSQKQSTGIRANVGTTEPLLIRQLSITG